MYKDVLRSIDNVAIWPVISFVIFFIFFLCLLWWVFTTDKNVLKEIESLPLNDGTPGNLKNENAELV
jgi:cytochrome c oxidase cbb3-type subunit IV